MGKEMQDLIEKLYQTSTLEEAELMYLLAQHSPEAAQLLADKADEVRRRHYGDKVYLRGLVEFTNYCHRHCMYCGIRSENEKVSRYRLSEEEILSCIEMGNALGYRTVVLQGGEDTYYTDDKLVALLEKIKFKWPQMAITLSIGERSYASYEQLFKAGADRYLLRHETASPALYKQLHPHMSYDNRMRCLRDLKDIGYQVGTGFIVGLPGQEIKDLVQDLMFIKSFKPHMVGIGPFMPQKDTPLGKMQAGTAQLTTYLISILRLLQGDLLLPATTSLGSVDPLGREKGLKAGANVVMPNLSPVNVREKYALYDGKICTGDEAAQCRGCIEKRIEKAGYKVDMGRGDHEYFGK